MQYSSTIFGAAGTLWYKNGQAHFVVSVFETTVGYCKINILLACYAISFVSNVRFLDVSLVFTIVSFLLLVRISNRSHHIVQFLYSKINRLNYNTVRLAEHGTNSA
ncbi:MAG: hypothetical protein PHI97_27905 [Desulfobulbus sp.]|jgi:uncharacterized protein YacL|nr:hypothetical protein [Desulfobulbus sp.]